MSLNEGCYYAIMALAESINNNCDLPRSELYISRIVDAMSAIAEIAVEIELSNRKISLDARLMESRVLLKTMLNDSDDYDDLKQGIICAMLIELAANNSNFNSALQSINSWLETDDEQRLYAEECPKYSIVPSILKAANWSASGVAA